MKSKQIPIRKDGGAEIKRRFCLNIRYTAFLPPDL